MRLNRISKKITKFIVIFTLIVPLFGEARDVNPNIPPNSQFKLQAISKIQIIQPSVKELTARISAQIHQPDYYEPITLNIKTINPRSIIKGLAKNDLVSSGNENKLEEWFEDYIIPRMQNNKLTLEHNDLQWLDLNKLANTLQWPTVEPYINKRDFLNSVKTTEMQYFWIDYLNRHHIEILEDIKGWIILNPNSQQIPLSLFLPRHSRAILHLYSHLRGRNCFGTALHFLNPQIFSDKNININSEPRHSKAMINSDEFLHALWTGYYELSDEEILTGLKWGDTIVFYEQNTNFGYRAIKHSIVHVAGDIYYHKQSKSAATPIEFTRWQNVTETWQLLTENLGFKVYRKLPLAKNGFLNQAQAIEKVRWTSN